MASTAQQIWDFIRNKKDSTGKTMQQAVLDKFKDIPAEFTQVPTMTPEQTELQGLVMSKLQQMLSPEGEGALGGAAAQEFQQQTLPGIAERFTSLGVSPESTGAFGQQVAQAQQGMLGKLLGQRQSQIPNYLMAALMPQFQTGMFPGQAGIGKQLFGGLLTAGQQAAKTAGKAYFLG